jgi:hypothetical protein
MSKCILVTSPGKVIESDNGDYYTKIIYGYGYYKKYLAAFDEVQKICQVRKERDGNEHNAMLQVNGDYVEVFRLPWTNGLIDYLRKREVIEALADQALKDCDAVSVRIPDPLSFYLIKKCHKEKIPFVVEITTDVWSYLSPENSTMKFRAFFRAYCIICRSEHAYGQMVLHM